MIPFWVLLGSLLIILLLDKFGWRPLSSVAVAFAWSLAIMFFFTGATHFTEMKHDYVALIPESLPRGLWVIYVTGALELAGAAGLVIPRFRRVAAVCLALLLLAIFPANIHAAMNEIEFRGKPPTALEARTGIQAIYISLLAWVALNRVNRVSSPA